MMLRVIEDAMEAAAIGLFLMMIWIWATASAPAAGI